MREYTGIILQPAGEGKLEVLHLERALEANSPAHAADLLAAAAKLSHTGMWIPYKGGATPERAAALEEQVREALKETGTTFVEKRLAIWLAFPRKEEGAPFLVAVAPVEAP